MKIGEFCKKNNVTQDTVRHYIDMGLLVVEKHGSQYKFTEENSNDIEKIVMLKQLDFSLTDIQEMLCFYRLEGVRSGDFRDFYISLLERKKDKIKIEQQKLKEIEVQLKDRINEVKMNATDQLRTLGFPISSVSLLHCPCCRRMLDITGGTIERSMILEATFHCECGYMAAIEDGIYIDKVVAGKKKKIPSKKDFLEVTSPKFINFLYNGTSALIEYIQNYTANPKYMLELDNCVGRFLLQYIDYLPKGCTYILNCHDKERLTTLKNNLELHQEHSNFIFFCCELDRIPIANSSIDIIVDHSMTKGYAKTTNQFLIDKVSPFLKEEGHLVGTYTHLGNKCKEFMNIPLGLRDYLSKNKIMEKLQNLNFAQLDSVDIGPITEDNPYIDFSGKEQYLTLYVGQKKINVDVISTGFKIS